MLNKADFVLLGEYLCLACGDIDGDAEGGFCGCGADNFLEVGDPIDIRGGGECAPSHVLKIGKFSEKGQGWIKTTSGGNWPCNDVTYRSVQHVER